MSRGTHRITQVLACLLSGRSWVRPCSDPLAGQLAGAATRFAEISWVLLSRRTVSFTESPTEYSRMWATSASAESTRSPLTAMMTSSTFRPAFSAGVPGETVLSLAPARVALPSEAVPSTGATPR